MWTRSFWWSFTLNEDDFGVVGIDQTLPFCDEISRERDQTMLEACQTRRVDVMCERFVGEAFKCREEIQRCVSRLDENREGIGGECTPIDAAAGRSEYALYL